MSAVPLIPGRLYRVRGLGLDLEIVAAHPCDAICIAIGMLMARETDTHKE